MKEEIGFLLSIGDYFSSLRNGLDNPKNFDLHIL